MEFVESEGPADSKPEQRRAGGAGQHTSPPPAPKVYTSVGTTRRASHGLHGARLDSRRFDGSMLKVARAHAPALAEQLGHVSALPGVREASRTIHRESARRRTWRDGLTSTPGQNGGSPSAPAGDKDVNDRLADEVLDREDAQRSQPESLGSPRDRRWQQKLPNAESVAAAKMRREERGSDSEWGEDEALLEARLRDAEVSGALSSLMESLTPRQYCVRQGRQSGERGYFVASSRAYLEGLEHAPADVTMSSDFRRSVTLLRSNSRTFGNLANEACRRRAGRRQRYDRLPTNRAAPTIPEPVDGTDDDSIDSQRRAHFERTWTMVKSDTQDLFRREMKNIEGEVREVLWANWDAIKLAFRMYSSDELCLQLEGYDERISNIKRVRERAVKEPEDDHFLGVMEFFSLMINTGLVTNKKTVKPGLLTKAQVNLLFVRANWEKTDQGNFVHDQLNPDNALMLHEFCAVLMRACKETMVLAPTLSLKLKSFLEEHLGKALMADRSGLRKDMLDPAIQNALRPYMRTLDNIFGHYGGLDDSGAERTIEAIEWRKLVRDMGLGAARHHQRTNEIFVQAQCADDFYTDDDPHDPLVPNSGADLVFSEFLEAIVRLAVMECYPGGSYPRGGDIEKLEDALVKFLDDTVISLAPAEDDQDSPNYERTRRRAAARRSDRGWGSVRVEPKARWMAAVSKTRKSFAVSSLLGLGKLSELSKADPGAQQALLSHVGSAGQSNAVAESEAMDDARGPEAESGKIDGAAGASGILPDDPTRSTFTGLFDAEHQRLMSQDLEDGSGGEGGNGGGSGERVSEVNADSSGPTVGSGGAEAGG